METPSAGRQRPSGLAGRAGQALCSLLLASLAWTPGVTAQDGGAATGASFEASTVVTTVQGDAAALGSGSVLIDVTPRLALGGSGTFMLGGHELAGSVPGSDLTLRMAFGGLLGHFTILDREPLALWVRLLAGVGNGKVELAVAGTEIASDNFGVLSPELGATLPLVGPLQAGLSAGYRATVGVQDLPGVSPEDLRGPFLRASFSLRLF